jgi:hypothetical protein
VRGALSNLITINLGAKCLNILGLPFLKWVLPLGKPLNKITRLENLIKKLEMFINQGMV